MYITQYDWKAITQEEINKENNAQKAFIKIQNIIML